MASGVVFERAVFEPASRLSRFACRQLEIGLISSRIALAGIVAVVSEMEKL